MSLTSIFFRSGRALGLFRTGDTIQYMVRRFHSSAYVVTVLVRLLYCMNLSDPEATLCSLRHGIRSSFYIKLHIGWTVNTVL